MGEHSNWLFTSPLLDVHQQCMVALVSPVVIWSSKNICILVNGPDLVAESWEGLFIIKCIDGYSRGDYVI